ncbi:MAG: S41 family peptidase, partial [Flavitalea sp.]
MIEYYFPYKYMTDVKWDEVLRTSLSGFLEAKNAYQYNVALTKLITSIDDSHGTYVNQKVKDTQFPYTFPFGLSITNDTAIVSVVYNDSLAELNGIVKNDIIVSIDDQPITELIKKLLPITAGSNYTAQLARMFWQGYLFSDSTRQARLGVLKNGKVEFKRVRRYTSNDVTVSNPFNIEFPKPKILPGNLYYADLSRLSDADVHKMMKTALKTRAIILDLRRLPPVGFNAICSYFTKKFTHFATAMSPDFTYPGYFKWIEELTIHPEQKRKLFKGPVFVLVNEVTQSQNEFTAMALASCDNVKIVGTQTSGADGNSTIIELPGNERFGVTWAGLYYPDKSPAQRVGVRIDIIVNPTVAGVIEGRDEILERAVLEAIK